MAKHFFLVFFLVVLTVVNGISAADSEKSQTSSSSKTLAADNKATVDNSTKSLIDSLGPSQDYPDYEIPKELAPDGVMVVGDYVPISPIGEKDITDTLAQPEADQDVKTSTPSSASTRSSSTVLAVVVAVGGSSLFFF